MEGTHTGGGPRGDRRTLNRGGTFGEVVGAYLGLQT